MRILLAACASATFALASAAIHPGASAEPYYRWVPGAGKADTPPPIGGNGPSADTPFELSYGAGAARASSNYTGTLVPTPSRPIRCRLAGGSLPAGLSVDGDGIVGVPSPTPPSGVQATISCTAGSVTREIPLTLVVTPNATATTAVPSEADGGDRFTGSIGLSGATGVSYSLASGSLDGSGLVLNEATGTISGTAAPGLFHGLTVAVVDAQGYRYVTEPFAIEVTETLAVHGDVDKAVLLVDVPFRRSFTGSGGKAPYTFFFGGNGQLATDATGFGGTLSAPGTYTPYVRITDARNRSFERPLVLSVASPLTVLTTTLPPATIGQALSLPLAAGGGVGPYAWSLETGSLPQSGVSLSGGALAGTVAGGVSNVSFRVTDADGRTQVTPTMSMVANQAPALVGQLSPPSQTVSLGDSLPQPYGSLSTTGGTGPFTWEVASGRLPVGMDLDVATGRVTGTATQGGTSTFTMLARDANGVPTAASNASTVTVQYPLALHYALPTLSRFQSVGAQPGTGGGKAPYTYARIAGSLPGGTTLASNGDITGTADTVGSGSFTIEVTDADGAKARQAVDWTVTDVSDGDVYARISAINVQATSGWAQYYAANTLAQRKAGLSDGDYATALRGPAGTYWGSIVNYGSNDRVAVEFVFAEPVTLSGVVVGGNVANGADNSVFTVEAVTSGSGGAYAVAATSQNLPGGKGFTQGLSLPGGTTVTKLRLNYIAARTSHIDLTEVRFVK